MVKHPLDTTPEAAAVQLAIHRRFGEAGRLRLAIEVTDLARVFARAGAWIRRQDDATVPVATQGSEDAMAENSALGSVSELLVRITAALDAAGIPYMLTGSFASSIHGTPRATRDVDIVIAPASEQIDALLAHLPQTDYYVSREAALDAVARHGQFNMIDLATGWKVDLIVRKPRDFSREEFERRRPVTLSGVAIDVASAEDILIAKLEWAKLGSSALQIEDAAGIIALQGERLDRVYVERWVLALDLRREWQEARARAE